MAKGESDPFANLGKMFKDQKEPPKLVKAIDILNQYHLIVKVTLFAILGFTWASSIPTLITGVVCVIALSILEYYRGLGDGTKMMMMYMSNKARDAMSAFDLMNDVLRGDDKK